MTAAHLASPPNGFQAGDAQLVFTHELGDIPGQLSLFFSARCSDDDYFISVVRYCLFGRSPNPTRTPNHKPQHQVRYSWGAFNPVDIEVNEQQVVLHLSRYMHMHGFWLPYNWCAPPPHERPSNPRSELVLAPPIISASLLCSGVAAGSEGGGTPTRRAASS